MKTNAKKLLTAIQPLVSNLSSKPLLPILECLKFDKGIITASDMEVEVSVTYDFSESYCLPAKLLADTLSSLGDIPVEIVDNKSHVELKTDNGRYKIPCYPVSDYPKSIEAKDATHSPIDATALFALADPVAYAVSSDDLRPQLCVIRLELEQFHSKSVATDGYKLASVTLPTGVSEPSTIHISKNVYKALKTAFNGVSVIDLYIDSDRIYVSSEDCAYGVSARLYDVSYPEYKNVIPALSDNTFIANRQEMLSALRRVQNFSSRETSVVVLNAKGGVLQITGASPESGTSAEEALAVEFSSDFDMKMGVNSKILSDTISNIPCEEMTFHYIADNKPLLLAAGAKYLSLVMPVMI